jgi:hypothetical protein
VGKNFEEIIEKYRRRIHSDGSIEEVIDGLHSEGLSITDAMKAVRILYGINLGEAKRLVTAHPIWSSVVRANEPLHDALEKYAASWSDDGLNATNTTDAENHE